MEAPARDSPKTVTRLERPSVGAKVEDIGNLIKDLSSRLDFDRVVRSVEVASPSGENRGALKEVFRGLFSLRRFEYAYFLGALGGTYSSLVDIESDLVHLREQYEQKGFLRQVPDQDYQLVIGESEKIGKDRRELEAKVGRALLVLRDAKTLNRIYRPTRASSIIGYPLEEIRQALDLENQVLVEGWERIDLDPRLLAATEKYVQSRLTNLALKGKYPQTLEQKKLYLDKARSTGKLNLKLGGLRENDPSFVLAPSLLLKNLYSTFPTYFITDIERLSISWEREKDLGLFIPKFTDNEYRGARIEIFLDPRISATASETERATKESWIMGIIYHELGHAILYKLSYDNLADWAAATQEEKIFVTWYVKKAAKEGDGVDEDFCESLMIFALNPAALKVIAPRRYEYLRHLFREYMDFGRKEGYDKLLDERIKAEEELWEVVGVIDKEIKDMYYRIYWGVDYE